MGDTATVGEHIITGMVCQHCVSAVTQEVAGIDGVTDVQVDLDTGRLRVTSTRPLDAAAVRAAVGEAGYEISD
jgi:copper chaperone